MKKVLEKGFSLPRCLVRDFGWRGRGSFAGNIGRKWKEGSGNAAFLSLYGRSVRGTWRILLDLGSRRICIECLGDGHLSHYEGPVLKPSRGGYFTGDPEEYAKQGSGNERLFPQGHRL